MLPEGNGCVTRLYSRCFRRRRRRSVLRKAAKKFARGGNFGREFLESLFTGNPLIHKSLKRLLPPPPVRTALLPTGRLCDPPPRPQNRPCVCLSAPRSVPQVKDSHSRSPPSAPGPGPVKRLCLYLPSSPHAAKRMRNLLARGQDERTDQGRQRGRRQIRPTETVRWTNVTKLWVETEETGGSLISFSPLRWFAIHSLGAGFCGTFLCTCHLEGS